MVRNVENGGDSDRGERDNGSFYDMDYRFYHRLYWINVGYLKVIIAIWLKCTISCIKFCKNCTVSCEHGLWYTVHGR